MDFELSDEHQMIVDTVRSFTEKELMPYEAEVEATGDVSPELVAQIKQRSLAAGLYAANMPAELGGGGLDSFGTTLVDRELLSVLLVWLLAMPSPTRPARSSGTAAAGLRVVGADETRKAV